MMFERNRDMVDRLLAREWSDRWAFLLFAIGGSILIWITKSFEVDPIIVACCAMALMLLYAGAVSLGPKLKLRADQLADNCYYLGLVFTLASLSYAIFTFDPAETATTIVQGFGVALVSTVLGLILRVFFSQGKPDLAMAEENARIALTETAAQLRAELDGVVLAFQSFAVQTRQHLTELRDEVSDDVGAVASTARQSIASMADEARGVVTGQASGAVEDIRKLSASVKGLIKAIEGHSTAIDTMAAKTAVYHDALMSVESAGTAATSALGQITSSGAAVLQYQEKLANSGETLAAAGEAIASTTSEMLKAAQHFDALVEGRLAALNKAPMKVSERLGSALSDTITQWEQTIARHAASQAEALQLLAKTRADELAAITRHNEALDSEISRSREKVAKVHAALVEMTSELTSQVSSTAR
jgi:chromosome segregation ATPase